MLTTIWSGVPAKQIKYWYTVGETQFVNLSWFILRRSCSFLSPDTSFVLFFAFQQLCSPQNVNCRDLEGRHSTPLHFAAGYNRVAVVEYLLHHGADVHAKDKGWVHVGIIAVMGIHHWKDISSGPGSGLDLICLSKGIQQRTLMFRVIGKICIVLSPVTGYSTVFFLNGWNCTKHVKETHSLSSSNS